MGFGISRFGPVIDNEPKLTYCALPSRLRHLTKETYDFVLSKGHAPLHPFLAFPEKDFADKSTFGRDIAMSFALELISAAQQFYLFGISDGTFREFYRASSENKPIHIFVEEFDPEWRKYYMELKPRMGAGLDYYLKRKELIK